MKNTHLSLALVSISALFLSGCQSVSTEETPQAGPQVVATTTMLGSVVSDILTCAVGNDSGLTVLFPIGADPHDFQPSSAQVAAMSSADLVVANGLFLEEGLVAALSALVEEGAPVLEVAELVDPLAYGDDHGHEDGHDDHADDHGDEEGHDDHGDDHGDEEGHDDHGDDHGDEEGHDDHGDDHGHKEGHDDHGDFDPHFWMDMSRMALVAELIGAELASSGEEFVTCGATVAEAIRAVDASVKETLAAIPEANRVLVTDHDALGYFADRYGFSVVGVVIPGGSTLAEPNSQALAELVDIIKEQNVPAIFVNTATESNVASVLANEAGQDVSVVNIYVGSVGGPGTGAETYMDMMTTNAALIAAALAD
jgi:zinc/manganese transport system substrate-binding protein